MVVKHPYLVFFFVSLILILGLKIRAGLDKSLSTSLGNESNNNIAYTHPWTFLKSTELIELKKGANRQYADVFYTKGAVSKSTSCLIKKNECAIWYPP